MTTTSYSNSPEIGDTEADETSLPESSEAHAGGAQSRAGKSNRVRERRNILIEQPQVLGASWAKGWFETMLSEGRQVSGGWPGTIPEARSRAQSHCDRELSLRGLPLLTQEELRTVAAATYERAKRDWLEAARQVRLAALRQRTSKA